jgi:hypothetical protein
MQSLQDSNVQYVFSGAGSIDPFWVRTCLNLFRERQVNIRRLVLLRAIPEHKSRDAFFSHMELQFSLPVSPAALLSPPFLALLEQQLKRQHWTQQAFQALN